MADTATHRYIKNPMPDYGSFIAASSRDQHSKEALYTSSADYSRLCKEIRSWLEENVALVLTKWPPESALAPASVVERSERDFSIYIGAG